MLFKTKLQLLVLVVGSAMVLSACQPVASPLMGIFYNETKFGNMVTSLDSGTKEGKACANHSWALWQRVMLVSRQRRTMVGSPKSRMWITQPRVFWVLIRSGVPSFAGNKLY